MLNTFGTIFRTNPFQYRRFGGIYYRDLIFETDKPQVEHVYAIDRDTMVAKWSRSQQVICINLPTPPYVVNWLKFADCFAQYFSHGRMWEYYLLELAYRIAHTYCKTSCSHKLRAWIANHMYAHDSLTTLVHNHLA